MTTNPPRKYFTRKRRALSAQQACQLSRKASMHLAKLQKQLPKNAKVGIYYDGFGELPTQPILDWCLRLGYHAHLPVVGTLGKYDQRLRFSPIYSKTLITLPTYLHSLGMKQHQHPIKRWVNELDVLFCPLVALDKTGTRMGMGGGYYDKTLAHTHKMGKKTPLTIGWCYDFQLVDKLTKQPWDIPMDMAITPSRLIRF